MVAFSYESLLKLERTSFTAKPKPEPVANFYTEEGDKGEDVVVPLSMASVIERINANTGGWPRRVGANLFIHDDEGVNWLTSPPALFGWLSARCGVIEWRRSIGCVTKEEVYQELCRTAKCYAAVEYLPHFPPLPGHYYACKEYPPGDGEAISKLVKFFSPSTNADRDLILGMFVTPFWGGKPGSRPAFLISSDRGRGVGKSKITDILSQLLGGCVELSAREDATKMRTRLLSPGGMKVRAARLDNVKSLNFSWAELESIITSPIISGHQMYQGEGTRPNTLSWIITLNAPSLSTDIAQRVIIVKLTKPQRIGAWESDVTEFVESHRDAIISDARAFLEMEPEPIPEHTRWAAWEDAILGRLHDPIGTQKIVRERSEISDVGREDIRNMEEHFADRLSDLGYSESDVVFIPSMVAAEWYSDVKKEKCGAGPVGKILTQFYDEETTKKIIPYRTENFRGFLFTNFELPLEEARKKFISGVKERLSEEKKSRYGR
jgi:hypothetical protein